MIVHEDSKLSNSLYAPTVRNERRVYDLPRTNDSATVQRRTALPILWRQHAMRLNCRPASRDLFYNYCCSEEL